MKRTIKAAAIAALLSSGWLFAVWPPPLWYRTHWPAETAFMWMRGQGGRGAEGRTVGRLYLPVPADSISPFVAEAVLIGEDNAFPTHGGIDWRSLRQAMGYRREAFSWKEPRDRQALWEVVPAAWSRREALRGASTITQQLAKNLYLSPSRNPLRKIKEAVTAYRLEATLGKDRILELYLNVAELGDGIWGVEAASQQYFKRSAAELSADQAAALAGSLPFPLRSNPGYRPGRMRWRQNLILRRMRGEQIEVPPPVTEDNLAPDETTGAVTDSSGADAGAAGADSEGGVSDTAGAAPAPDSLLSAQADSLGAATPPDTTK
jgi:monofunctional biosynthetic peptidoglycan transglycosylase